MNYLNDIEIGYIAGFLDADGQISITKHHSSSGLGFLLHARLVFHNTNIDSLKWIMNLIGGNIRAKNPRNPFHKIGYVLEIGKCKDIIETLKVVSPYLHIRHERAELLIEFCHHRIQMQNISGLGIRGGRKRRYTVIDLGLYEKMIALNKKGIEIKDGGD